MAEPAGGRRCSACGRLLHADDEWIALDGGETWCAECWGQRFAAPPEAPKPAEGAAAGQPAAPATETGPTTSPAELRPCSNCGHMCAPEMQTCPACGGEPWGGSDGIAVTLEEMAQSGQPSHAATGVGPEVTQASVSAPFVSVTQGQPVARSGPGTPVVHQINIGGGPGVPLDTRKISGLAVASFVLSLVGLLLIPLLLPQVLGLVFGAIAVKEIGKQAGLSGRGLAIAGFVISIIALLLWFVWLVETVRHPWPWNF